MSKNQVIWLPALLLLVGGALASCGGGEAKRPVDEDQPSVRARVQTVEKRPIRASYEAVGTVRARLSSVLSSRVMGQVLAVRAYPGDNVKAGQILAEIDSRDSQANLSKAKAGLSEAQNALQEVEESQRAAEAGKSAADAGAALAASTYKRFQALVERKSVSQQEFDEAEFKYKASLAEVTRAEQGLLATQSRKRQVLDRIEQAKAEVRNAETFLSYASVTAPYAGVITARDVEAGAMSAPGVPLLTIEDTHDYQLEASVEESQLSRIKMGDRVPVGIDALRQGDLVGVVSEIVPTGDPSSRSFLVKVRLPMTTGLRTGMFGRARFAGDQQETLTIPASAIISRGQLTGALVVDQSNRARFRVIKTGKQYEDQFEVLSGLDAGERVIVEAPSQVPDGSPVSAAE